MAAATVIAARLALPLPFSALRETAADGLLSAFPRPHQPVPVLTVEIDRESLAALGPWPWPRNRLAALVTALHEAGAAVVATDILFAGPDRASPAGQARIFAENLPPAEAALLRARAADLPDHDQALADALDLGPSVLGFLLAPEPGEAPTPQGGFAVVGDAKALAPLSAPGAATALPLLVEAALGHGAASLEGGRVRAVPLVVRVDEEWLPGLVTEALRLATGAASPVLIAGERVLRLGGVNLPLDAALSIRLQEGPAGARVSAEAVLAGRVPRGAIEDQIVLLGGTAPELGALRETAFAPLVPGIRLQAMALAQAMTLWLPRRPDWLPTAEIAGAAALGLGAALAGAGLPPLAVAGLAALALVALPLGAVALLHGTLLLADPVLPLASTLAGLGASFLAGFMALRASRARLVARFAQSLPPALVARIAKEPGLLRIGGERRRMSFVFTDIAGFTALAERSGPQALITMLDAYVAGGAEIVAKHGGTLDKVVGDALHIMFGAPLDQPDHAARAIACGQALAAFGQDFAARHAAAGFGITRVGIATGDVIVGDVGGGRVLDYTAHGDAVNLAARLEAANKIFGTVLLSDAESVAAAGAAWRRLARLEARGREAVVEVFTPWPDAEAPRDSWDAALAALEAGEAATARAAFTRFAEAVPADAATRFQLARLEKGVVGLAVGQN